MPMDLSASLVEDLLEREHHASSKHCPLPPADLVRSPCSSLPLAYALTRTLSRRPRCSSTPTSRTSTTSIRSCIVLHLNGPWRRAWLTPIPPSVVWVRATQRPRGSVADPTPICSAHDARPWRNMGGRLALGRDECICRRDGLPRLSILLGIYGPPITDVHHHPVLALRHSGFGARRGLAAGCNEPHVDLECKWTCSQVLFVLSFYLGS